MANHRSPDPGFRRFLAGVIASGAALVVIGGAAGAVLDYAVLHLRTPAPRVVTRVVTRRKVLEVPAPLTGCQEQLQTALAGVFPWMRAHRYALPVAANGWKPDTSDCDKGGR